MAPAHLLHGTYTRAAVHVKLWSEHALVYVLCMYARGVDTLHHSNSSLRKAKLISKTGILIFSQHRYYEQKKCPWHKCNETFLHHIITSSSKKILSKKNRWATSFNIVKKLVFAQKVIIRE